MKLGGKWLIEYVKPLPLRPNDYERFYRVRLVTERKPGHPETWEGMTWDLRAPARRGLAIVRRVIRSADSAWSGNKLMIETNKAAAFEIVMLENQRRRTCKMDSKSMFSVACTCA